AALRALTARTTVVLTTVGPYQLYGNDLVAACVETGTAYVDLCGEPNWMHDVIARHQDAAKASGARIVLSCGFDSIPFDLGVWTAEQAAIAKWGRPAPRVKGRVRKMQGTFSGGTFASGKATAAAAAKNPLVFKILLDPFALTPGFTGPDQPKGMMPEYDEAVGGWVAPFVMAVINTKNVHRTNFLAGHPYGTDFRYDEMMVAPGLGDIGKAAAEAIAKMNPMNADKGPAPGEGPSKEEREAGFYEIDFIAEMPTGESLTCTVTGDRDPGYGSTSKMIAEAALCLIRDVAGDGGVWTPGALMAEPLKARLEANAGLKFVVKG
ncbi:saccharopine dehydrogenase family protein, partial [Sphingomonas sp. CCH9-H8]